MSDVPAPAMPGFDGFADQLLVAKSLASPTDLQGVLCGRLCGSKGLNQAQWHDLARLLMDLETLPTDLVAQLDALHAATLGQLAGEGFDFDLLLPDDHIELAMRVQSLASFCSSFMHGLGGAGIKGDTQFSAEAAEALRDLAAIAQMEADTESDEASFMEVAEYVRMAVLTLYMELAPRKDVH
ncbi:UPF0149 family protein [Simiduia agarivorans]|uniref:YecA family protein n=1 Tax=Simiduia agarivorans (strain DSM 21679 / JCM 13881 / BCRC 17597 / SA1) TaxID=1117647 RepID=K4KLD0_SIMAS|nr:UPF0149 family protein [Simiduia agarivorans]AFU99969.1 YecA family protein [Simiduia agarivorans SA1 = DSM 21679]